jgi:peptidoglycan-N-acetylglucosamine deacetylase
VAATIFEGLRDRGFSLVTVKQLFGGALPDSGAWRSAR